METQEQHGTPQGQDAYMDPVDPRGRVETLALPVSKGKPEVTEQVQGQTYVKIMCGAPSTQE